MKSHFKTMNIQEQSSVQEENQKNPTYSTTSSTSAALSKNNKTSVKFSAREDVRNKTSTPFQN